MTTTTATFIHKTKNQHIRTYMPDHVAETLKIKNGDKIDWKIEARGGEVVAVLRKAPSTA